jgi:hypothetical protein
LVWNENVLAPDAATSIAGQRTCSDYLKTLRQLGSAAFGAPPHDSPILARPLRLQIIQRD